MYSFLDKLRKKEKTKQESFIFFSALTITLFIALVWLFTLVYDLKKPGADVNLASPVKVFSNQIKSMFNSTEVYNAVELNKAEN